MALYKYSSLPFPFFLFHHARGRQSCLVVMRSVCRRSFIFAVTSYLTLHDYIMNSGYVTDWIKVRPSSIKPFVKEQSLNVSYFLHHTEQLMEVITIAWERCVQTGRRRRRQMPAHWFQWLCSHCTRCRAAPRAKSHFVAILRADSARRRLFPVFCICFLNLWSNIWQQFFKWL